MTRAGEHLYLGDDRGALELANLWADEVEACVSLSKPMPEYVVAICLDPPSIRDVTREFEAAVAAAQRPEVGFPSSYVIREGRAA